MMSTRFPFSKASWPCSNGMFCIAVVFWFLGMEPVMAGAMLLHIGTTRPRVIQRGVRSEITIQGICIKDAQDILFYRPGVRLIQIESLPDLEHPIGLAHGGRIVDQIRCHFEVDPDCLPGEMPFRIRTRTELSSIGTFHISPFLAIDEGEGSGSENDTIENAKVISKQEPVTIRGRMNASSRGDVDLYRVNVRKGQTLSAEVDSVRIADIHYGDSEYDLALRVLDMQGKPIGANDDNALHLQDPIVSVPIDYDGVAYIEVKRSLFVPRDTEYVLHLGSYERPFVVFPMGGKIGDRFDVQWADARGGLRTHSIALTGAKRTFDMWFDAPSPVQIRATELPNFLERSDDVTQRIESLPVALNGRIDARGDTDTYRFHVEKGTRWRIRVYAASLGSAIDPVIRLRRVLDSGEPGPIVQEADDSSQTQRDFFGASFRSGGGLRDILDPSIIWESSEEGDYAIEIWDNAGVFGTNATYRIEVEEAVDGLHTVLTSTAFDWQESVRTSSITVPRGNRWTVNVSLAPIQGNSYRGEIELVARGLPQGVRMLPARVPSGQMSWPVQFVCDSSTKPTQCLIEIDAIPLGEHRAFETSSHQVVPFINHSGGDAWRTVSLSQYALAVTDPAPFVIDIGKPEFALVRGGELAIPLRVRRRDGFNEAIEFHCDWVPPGVSVQPATLLAADSSESVLRVTCDPNTPVGSVPLVVVGTTVRDDMDAYLGTGRIRVSSSIREVRIAESFVELTSVPESIRRGETKRMVWKVQHKNAFEGNASVRLLGLPKGVSFLEPMPVINSASDEIAFKIQASEEALLGNVKGLSCEVIVNAAGQEIRQRTGSGTLRIDPMLSKADSK